MDLTIYTLTHKHFTKPDDNMYVPLQVGTAINSPLGYLRDDTGDNISALNGYYSELTGLYWIWKNVHDINYVGTCHYRRYLIDENEHIMNEKQYEQIFKEYELVTTKRVVLNNSYHYGFPALSKVHCEFQTTNPAIPIIKLITNIILRCFFFLVIFCSFCFSKYNKS